MIFPDYRDASPAEFGTLSTGIEANFVAVCSTDAVPSSRTNARIPRRWVGDNNAVKSAWGRGRLAAPQAIGWSVVSGAGDFHGFHPGNMITTGDQNSRNERLNLISIRIGVPSAS